MFVFTVVSESSEVSINLSCDQRFKCSCPSCFHPLNLFVRRIMQKVMKQFFLLNFFFIMDGKAGGGGGWLQDGSILRERKPQINQFTPNLMDGWDPGQRRTHKSFIAANVSWQYIRSQLRYFSLHRKFFSNSPT